MRLSPEQTEVLEQTLTGDGWDIIQRLVNDRLADKHRHLASARLDAEEYQRTCGAIRELEYLRDEPMRLVRKQRMEQRSA